MKTVAVGSLATVAGLVPCIVGGIAFWKRGALKQKARAARNAKVSTRTKPGQSARQIKGAARVGAQRLKNEEDEEDLIPDAEADNTGATEAAVEMARPASNAGARWAAKIHYEEEVVRMPINNPAEPEPEDVFNSLELPAKAPPMHDSVLKVGRRMD